MGINQGLSGALTTELDSLVFDDLLYFVMWDAKDKRKFCNIMLDMD